MAICAFFSNLLSPCIHFHTQSNQVLYLILEIFVCGGGGAIIASLVYRSISSKQTLHADNTYPLVLTVVFNKFMFKVNNVCSHKSKVYIMISLCQISTQLCIITIPN